MPLPKPKKTDKRKDFVERFMKSKSAKKEFKKTDQRLAVAFSKWRSRG